MTSLDVILRHIILRAAHRPCYGDGRKLYGSQRYAEPRTPSVHLLVEMLNGTVRLVLRPFDGIRVQTVYLFTVIQTNLQSNMSLRYLHPGSYHAWPPQASSISEMLRH